MKHIELKQFFPVDGVFDLANATLNLNFKSVLDIGIGVGGATAFFTLAGKDATAIGLNVDLDDTPKKIIEQGQAKVIETPFSNFEAEEQFDAIWASHVLEHVLDTGAFLSKCYDHLADDGWLFIMVPKFKHQVVGGHVTNGWNTGQLMYNLLMTGYDIKNGHFICHGYSVCAFVQKAQAPLPELRMDGTDIETTRDLWPIEVSQGFNGDIPEINWFSDFPRRVLPPPQKPNSFITKIMRFMSK